MSVASAIRPAGAVYREEQNFAWWVYALLVLMAATSTGFLLLPARGGNPGPTGSLGFGTLVGLGLPLVLVVGVLRMTTEVTPAGCCVWFGWIPSYQRTIPLVSVQQVEVVTYRPLQDCGGWGIRKGAGCDRVLSARGNRAVRITLVDGTRLLIGSQRPEELAQVLGAALRPAA
jgi:hypothetical protein